MDQYKQKGYAQKLKTNITNITPEFSKHSQDLIKLLNRQVTHIDGMY